MHKNSEIKELKGLVLKEIIGMEKDSDEIIFRTNCGREFIMYHDQDCCEDVHINDVVGDVSDLIGREILFAEESSNEDMPQLNGYDCSYTWTFYKLATIKGFVDIRWYGSSNGYYSESVDFAEITK